MGHKRDITLRMRARESVDKASQELRYGAAKDCIEQQLKIANYLAKAEVGSPGVDIEEYSNNSLWERIIFGHARAENVLKLNSFFVFEWLPRAPGLYFTPGAWQAQTEAYRDIIDYEAGMAVLHPSAKTSLVQAGVGSVRLKPIVIDGQSLYMMSASSEGNCDEGFPIAITPHMYDAIIDEIRSRGCVSLDIVGRLKYTPDSLDQLYRHSRDVPQIYLKVEDISNPTREKSRRAARIRVSVSTLFEGSVDGEQGDYFAFVTFDPGEKGELERAVDWLENSYVQGRYSGKVLTDFDQIQSRFRDAPFSLDRILNPSVNFSDAKVIIKRLSIDESLLDLRNSTIQQIQVNHMEKTVTKVSGSGHVVIVKSDLRDTVIKVNSTIENSPASDEIKNHLASLTKAIEDLNGKIGDQDSNKLGKNLTKLAEEASEEEPDKGWLTASLDGIKKTAESIGTIAEPVLNCLKMLWPLLLGHDFGS